MEGKVGVMHRHVGGSLLQPGGDPFKFAAHRCLSGVLRSTGFNSIDEEAKTLPWMRPGSVEEVWDQAQAVAGGRSLSPGSEFPPRSGRKFTPRLIGQSVKIRMARRSRSECQSRWRREKSERLSPS